MRWALHPQARVTPILDRSSPSVEPSEYIAQPDPRLLLGIQRGGLAEGTSGVTELSGTTLSTLCSGPRSWERNSFDDWRIHIPDCGWGSCCFATNLHVAHISLRTIGLILMIAGLAGLVLGLVQQSIWSRRSRHDLTIEERREPREPY